MILIKLDLKMIRHHRNILYVSPVQKHPAVLSTHFKFDFFLNHSHTVGSIRNQNRIKTIRHRVRNSVHVHILQRSHVSVLPTYFKFQPFLIYMRTHWFTRNVVYMCIKYWDRSESYSESCYAQITSAANLLKIQLHTYRYYYTSKNWGRSHATLRVLNKFFAMN